MTSAVMPREAGIQYAAAFEGDNNCHGVLGSSAFADDDSRGWGSSSNGTETPIQRFSVRQDDLSVASRLPVLSHYRPSKERIKNDSALGHLETSRRQTTGP